MAPLQLLSTSSQLSMLSFHAKASLSLQSSDPVNESSEKPKPPSLTVPNHPSTADMALIESLEMTMSDQKNEETPQLFEDKKPTTDSEQNLHSKDLPVEYGNDESEDTKDVGQVDYLEMVRQAWWEMRPRLSTK